MSVRTVHARDVSKPAQNELIVFDTASLRFAHNNATWVVTTGHGAPIATVTVAPGTGRREAALAALDAALAATFHTPDGQRLDVALYNPVTSEVAVRPLPHTISYGPAELHIPASGARARRSGVELIVAGHHLTVRAASLEVARRAARLHAAA